MSEAGSQVTLLDLSTVGRWRGRRLLREFYREVLVPAFDPAELQSLRSLRQDVLGRRGTVTIRVALDDEGAVLGGLLLDWDPDLRVGLFGHLAVRAGNRGRGFGTMLLNAVIADAIADLRPVLLLAEVQDPRVHPPTAGQDPVARVRLYHRLGVQLVAVPWVAPKVRDDVERFPGVFLLNVPTDPAVPAESLPVDVLEPFLRRYFELCEGEDAERDDPKVAALFSSFAGKDTVPLVSLLDYEHLPVTT